MLCILVAPDGGSVCRILFRTSQSSNRRPAIIIVLMLECARQKWQAIGRRANPVKGHDSGGAHPLIAILDQFGYGERNACCPRTDIAQSPGGQAP